MPRTARGMHLRVSSRAVILATSRETLRTTGEHATACRRSTCPHMIPVRRPRSSATVPCQLFLDRAEATHMAGLRDGRICAYRKICRHLDGMPLAIEFAAARAASLGLAQVADGLRDRFALLTTGRRTALPRHQTLRAALDWSYALLPDAERLLLHRLAIFSGGFSFEAACAVMREHSPADVADSIASLVEKSVVNLEQATFGGRWRCWKPCAPMPWTSSPAPATTRRRHAGMPTISAASSPPSIPMPMRKAPAPIWPPSPAKSTICVLP